MNRIQTWLKQHAAIEKSFARVLRRFFEEQADRIADAAENVQGLSPEQVSLIFRADDEHELFMPMAKRNLANIMAAGARAELEHAESLSKAFDPETDIACGGLPAETRQRILAALDDVSEQDYWLAIQAETERNIVDIIQDGISQGFGDYKISMAIREHLGGFAARKRSLKIARTEVTGAYNAGHVAQMQTLGAAVDGKKWVAISDDDTRESHSAADGQTVRGVDASFTIGGFEAPYPGHFALPAVERVNCRCVVLSVLNEGILAAAENPEFDE